MDNHRNIQLSARIICSYALHYCNKNLIAVDFEEKQTIQSTLDMLDPLIDQATME